MSQCVRTVALLALVVGLSGCSLFKGTHGNKPGRQKEKPGATAPASPRLVGTVTVVNSDDGFVLVDFGMQPTVAPGTKLTTRTDGTESGELLVGDVHKRPFVIADIVKGSPQKGDQVFY
jgi:hypothetical protein